MGQGTARPPRTTRPDAGSGLHQPGLL